MPAKEDFNFSGLSGSNSYLLSKPQGGLQHANGKNGAARQGGKEVGNVSSDSFFSEEDDDVDAADDDLSGSIDHDSKPAPQAAPRQSVPQVSMASGSAAASMRPSDQTRPIAVRSAQQHNLSASGETADLLLSRENSHHAASPRNGPSQAALGSATPSKRISSPMSSPGNPAQAAVNNPISGSNRPSSTSLPMQPQFNASAGATHSTQQQQASNASTVFGSAAAQQAALSQPNSQTSTPRMSGPSPLPYTAATGSPAGTSRQHPMTPSQLQNAADRAAASRRASGDSQNGSPGLGYDPLGSLPVPQLHDGGRSPMASYGGDMSDGLLRMGHSPLGQSARQSHAGSTVSTNTRRTRLAESEFNIPLPLELFCMYDQDGSGGVGKKEFVHLVRDVDGHPVHYAEDDDPEYKRDEAKAALAVLEAKLEKCKVSAGRQS